MSSIRLKPPHMPAWCTGFQCSETEPRDRFHEVTGPIVPGVFRHVERDGATATAAPQACELHTALFTSAVHPDELWIAVELGEYGPGLTLTVESVRRLLPALQALVAIAEG